MRSTDFGALVTPASASRNLKNRCNGGLARFARGGAIRTTSEIKNEFNAPQRSHAEFALIPWGQAMAMGGKPTPSDVWTEIDQILNPVRHFSGGGNVSPIESRRAMREGYLPHAAGFPHMADGGIVSAILRNRALQRSGRTVDEMMRDSSGLRRGEARIPTGGRAGSITRRIDPEGNYIPGSTEADDQFRAQQGEIYDMAARRMRERRGYADGGDVNPFGDPMGGAVFKRRARQSPSSVGLQSSYDDLRALHDDITDEGPDYISERTNPQSNALMQARRTLDRHRDYMGRNDPSALRSAMLGSGWGVPDYAMEPEGIGFAESLPEMLMMGMSPRNPVFGGGLTGWVMPSFFPEAEAPEMPMKDWRWSASSARARGLIEELANRLPRMAEMGRRPRR